VAACSPRLRADVEISAAFFVGSSPRRELSPRRSALSSTVASERDNAKSA